MSVNHNWTYEEVYYCTKRIVECFVINRELDYNILLDELFIYFDMKIKKGSLKMFFSNTKHLFTMYNIPNTLTISELTNYSQMEHAALIELLQEYNKNKKI